MGDGWRNRFMAPVYALGISFLFVFVLGFWFGERQTVIQFQTPQPKKDATVTAFPRVFVVVSGKEQSDVIVVGMLVTPGEFSFPSSDKNVRVCLDVPSGWSIAPPLQTEVMGGLVCLSVTPDQNNIDVVLSGPGS